MASPKKLSSYSAFSLVELLVVIAIIGILASLSGPAISGMSSSQRIQKNIAQVASLLEQARVVAVTQNTYSYVFFREDTINGNMDAVLISSRTGLDPFKNGVLNLDASAADISVVHKKAQFEETILKKKNTIPVSGNSGVDRPQPPFLSDLGDSLIFTMKGETYNRCIMFRPTGEATVPTLDFAGLVEFAIQPRQDSTPSPRAAVLQIAGATGQTKVYRSL